MYTALDDETNGSPRRPGTAAEYRTVVRRRYNRRAVVGAALRDRCDVAPAATARESSSRAVYERVAEEGWGTTKIVRPSIYESSREKLSFDYIPSVRFWTFHRCPVGTTGCVGFGIDPDRKSSFFLLPGRRLPRRGCGKFIEYACYGSQYTIHTR